jgi:hypothetical protein
MFDQQPIGSTPPATVALSAGDRAGRLSHPHQLGLRRGLAALEQRGLIRRYRGGWLELTEAGTAAAGECNPMTDADIVAETRIAVHAMRRRLEAVIAAGRLQPNGKQWD